MILTREEKLHQLENLLRSRALHGSENLKAFLRFVVTRMVDDEETPLKEYVIASEVFGQSKYDPRIDSIVRVQAGRLRLKLRQYYETEGQADRVVIDLPKGHYTPTFTLIGDAPPRQPTPPVTNTPEDFPNGTGHAPMHTNGAETNAPVAADEATAPPAAREANFSHSDAPARPSKLLTATLALTLICLLLGGTSIYYRAQTQRLLGARDSTTPGGAALTSLAPAWSGLMASDDPVLIVYSNALFEGTPATGMKFAKPLNVNAPPTTDARAVAANTNIYDTYTGVGEVMGIHFISTMLQRAGHTVRVKRSTTLTWEEAKSDNIIFLGSPSENMFLRELPQAQEFIFETADQSTGELRIVNTVPQAGEQADYRLRAEGTSAGQITEDYAIVSMLRGFDDKRHILVLAGITTLGTQAAAEYVTKPEYLAELTARLNTAPAEAAPRLPDYYQVILRVQVKGGVPVQTSYVTHHVLR